MKRIIDVSLIVIGILSVSLSASNIPNLKKTPYLKIEKNVSKNFIAKVQQKAKKRGIAMVVNPTFNCSDAGFKKSDLFAKGTMYGKNRKDGSLEIGGEGDFKAYSYERYKQKERECVVTSYTKAYDPARYGKESYAVIMGGQ